MLQLIKPACFIQFSDFCVVTAFYPVSAELVGRLGGEGQGEDVMVHREVLRH